MTNRLYSSFLLRFWLVETPELNEESPDNPTQLSLQIQNLQTGVTWKFSSLQELHNFLAEYLKEPVTNNSADKLISDESN